MASYSYSDIMRLQNEAARRVENMNRLSREVAGATNLKQTSNNAENNREKPVIKENPVRVQMPKNYLDTLKNYGGAKINSNDLEKRVNAVRGGERGAFKLPELDSDTSLILSLLLLLSEEKADESLLLAMLYMLT